MKIVTLESERLERAKCAFSTRRVVKSDIACVITGPDIQPKVGDLVLAKVEELGKHSKLELTNGRRALMFPGDEIVVAYGNRYAPDQFEATIGSDLVSL